jgi:PST family polysaccharide transporter
MNSKSGKTMSSSVWSACEASAGQVISFLVFLVMARLLNVADFGVIALANIYILFAQYLVFQGLGQAIVQFQDLDEEHLSTAFWINLGLGLILAAGTFCSAGLLAVWFSQPALAGVLRLLSPILILAALADIQTNLLARRMQFKSLALRTLLSYTMGGVVGIGMALKGFGVWSFCGQQLVIWLVNLVALWAASEWRPRLNFSPDKARRLLKFGSNLLWVDLVGLAYRRVDQVLVGRFAGSQMLGFYAVGSRVSSLVGEVLIRSFARVSLSTLSRLQDDAARFTAMLYRIFEMQWAIILPVALGAALLAGEIVEAFFGAAWVSAVPVMQVLLLGIPFEALSAVHFSALIARGHPRWCSILTTFHALLNLLFCGLAIRHGSGAVAWAVTLRAVVIYPLEILAVKRVLPLSVRHVAGALLPLLGAVGIMAAGVYFIGQTVPASLPVSVRLGIGILVGAVLYVLALVVLKPRLTRELWSYRRLLMPMPKWSAP